MILDDLVIFKIINFDILNPFLSISSRKIKSSGPTPKIKIIFDSSHHGRSMMNPGPSEGNKSTNWSLDLSTKVKPYSFTEKNCEMDCFERYGVAYCSCPKPGLELGKSHSPIFQKR